MPRRWLSFWNQEIQRLRNRNLESAPDPGEADIWVPYGKDKLDKLARRDSVYCVGFEKGTRDLLLFGRLTIGRIDDDLRHRESLKVWAESGSSTFPDEAEVISDSVDNLVFLWTDDTEHRFVRKPPGSRKPFGTIDSNPFQGRSSIREIDKGFEILDRRLDQ